MSDFVSLWKDGPSFAESSHFKLSTDSILLADFINIAQSKRGIDLGCGSGIISLLLLSRSERLCMTGLEINPEAAELAGANMEKNAFGERSQIVTGDIRQHRELFRAGSFDLAAANPPYFPENSGLMSPKSDRAAARGELQCTLRELCEAAAFLLKTGGSFFVVHRSERLSELFCTMSECGLEPKRLRLVQHRLSAAPSLVLAEGRRGGKPGVKIEPTLILSEEDGKETEEYRKIYHR